MDVKQKVRCLKQLRYLRGEVDQLSQRIARLEQAARDGAGSRARLEAMRGRLARRREECMEQLGALYAFIDDIDDSLTRQIMASRYIDGYAWRCVAGIIGERDEQYPRRLHNRFLARTELPAALAGGGNKTGREGAEREEV